VKPGKKKTASKSASPVKPSHAKKATDEHSLVPTHVPQPHPHPAVVPIPVPVTFSPGGPSNDPSQHSKPSFPPGYNPAPSHPTHPKGNNHTPDHFSIPLLSPTNTSSDLVHGKKENKHNLEAAMDI